MASPMVLSLICSSSMYLCMPTVLMSSSALKFNSATKRPVSFSAWLVKCSSVTPEMRRSASSSDCAQKRIERGKNSFRMRNSTTLSGSTCAT